jgi:hypothetical protein
MSVSTKRQCDRTLGELRAVLREARASDLRLRVQVRQRSNLLYKVHRSHRCIGAKVYRNVVPWHPLHRRQWGIPMHSYENRSSQIRALIWWERGSIARINLKGPGDMQLSVDDIQCSDLTPIFIGMHRNAPFYSMKRVPGCTIPTSMHLWLRCTYGSYARCIVEPTRALVHLVEPCRAL